MTPNSEIAQPLLPHIERDGDRLVVLRGADFSACCFRCARDPAGRPIVKYLHIDKSGAFHRPGLSGGGNALFLLDVLEFLLWLVWSIVDWPKSRRRRISFGLCTEHRRRRRLLRAITNLGFPLGAVLAVAGLFGDLAAPMDAIAFACGAALVTAGGIAAASGSDPKLAGESAHFLWLKGAGQAFLDRQPVRRI